MTTLHATHIGTATVLLELRRGEDRVCLVTDPVFSAAGTRYTLSGVAPLSYTNLRPPALLPRALPPIDVVLLSHDQHRDNFDHSGRQLARGARRVLTTRTGARRLARNALSNVMGLAPWDTTELTVGGLTVRVTATPARHGPAFSRPIVGPVVGFLLEWTDNQHGPLWISGDTVWHRKLEPLADRGIGVALVHAGAAHFALTGRIRYTMDGRDVARAARCLNPHTIVPIHYEGWSHFRQGRAEVTDALGTCDLGDRCVWLTPGEQTELQPPVRSSSVDGSGRLRR